MNRTSRDKRGRSAHTVEKKKCQEKGANVDNGPGPVLEGFAEVKKQFFWGFSLMREPKEGPTRKNLKARGCLKGRTDLGPTKASIAQLRRGEEEGAGGGGGKNHKSNGDNPWMEKGEELGRYV